MGSPRFCASRGAEIAKREGMEKMRAHKFMKLARLAPHYVEAIARGQGPIGLSFESWPSTCRVHQRQNPHDFALHFVNQSVVFVRNQLARARNLTCFSKVWVIRQAGGSFGKKLIHPDGCEWVVIADVINDVCAVLFGT